ncbi:sodium:solute symporter [Psychroflexus montanilacus]|uniref:sodium:solute symporter n=1 Tax=Psychroflexus montanilacus TaxID=2873598 RepID=UPI001CCEF078|nr:sodium:solute symporter [Psychroflexus montanilacus]MBZ9651130.1 sodium:solute symporter [Psychroflexus montanilacus]
METIDFIILFATLAFIVIYGSLKSRKNANVDDFIKGGNQSRWWTVGLSVMATQASAITFLSTPGQAFHDGMGFVQFYFGLPIAIIIICLVFLPIYHRLKVYTAYEYLESRFDLKTRSLTAGLFLIQRSLAAGITIYAPSIILSAVLGWNLFYLNIMIGILVIIYTVTGGTQAVNVTQKQQMGVIFLGLITAFVLIFSYLPDDITFNKAMKIAGANNKLDVLDFSFSFDNRYTFWSGIIGGSFLALSYFGTDQSQVQRYLSGKSLRESQMGLIFNAILKVPLQFFILLIGVMVFVFYQFNYSPINFNPAAKEAVMESEFNSEFESLETQLKSIQDKKNTLANQFAGEVSSSESEHLKTKLSQLNSEEFELRDEAKTIISKVDDKIETNDKDYVFIHFIINNLPRGLVGLLLAVILSAAMSSTASELNALASTTTIDLYKRNKKTSQNEKHYVNSTKLFTLGWGIFAIIFACTASLFDNLIQLVNIIGSIFYGNVLGIFLLAFFIKFVTSRAVFIAAIITQIIVLIGYFQDWMPYLWLNLFGCGLVVSIAILIQMFTKKPTPNVESV